MVGQLPDVDCGRIYAHVCRVQIIRVVLATAVEYNLRCWQLYSNNTFQNDITGEVRLIRLLYFEYTFNGIVTSALCAHDVRPLGNDVAVFR